MTDHDTCGEPMECCVSCRAVTPVAEKTDAMAMLT